MIKSLLTIVFSIGSTLVFSQVKFGVKAGGNLANMEVKSPEIDELGASSSPIPSFHLGGFAEISLSKKMYFQPTLLVSGKGYKIDYSASQSGYTLAMNGKTNLLYLEAPLNIIGKFDAAPGFFLLGGGPYVGYALKGKSTGNIMLDGPGTDEDFSMPLDGDTEFGDGDLEYKRVDFGLNLLAGYESKKGRFLNLGYGLGLRNLNNAENSKEKHGVISLSVGFKLK